jgi:hypothetical protein
MFVKQIEGQGSSYFYSSLDEIFTKEAEQMGKKSPTTYVNNIDMSGKEMMQSVDQISAIVAEKTLVRIRKTLQFDNLFSLFISGSYKTPKDVEMYLVRKGFTGGSTALYIAGRAFFSYVIVPTVIGMVQAIIDGMIKGQGLKGKEVYSDNLIMNLVGAYVGPRIIDNIMGKGLYSLCRGTGGADGDWWESLGTFIPGYADNTVMDFFTILEDGTHNDGESVEDYTNRQANENLTKAVTENLKDEYKKAEEKDKVLISKGQLPTNVKKITNNKLNNMHLTKRRIDGLVSSKDITKQEADFLKTRLKYIPEVPLDFLYLVKKKQKALTDKGGEGLQELLKLDGMFGKFDNFDAKKMPETSVGSVVLTAKSGNQYLVLNALTDYPTTTPDVLEIIKDNGEVVWVSPKFKDLKTNTERKYNNISTFVKQFNIL